jgi:replication factor A1
MGAIEDVYEDLEADVSRDEFEASVHEKVAEMDGLADEETAAMLVAHELQESGGEVEGVADVDPDMDEVKFVAKVTGVGEVRTFERDGDDPDGKVANVEVADETGRVRVSFWDDLAEGVERGELEPGEVLKIKGRPKEGYAGVEVSVDRAEVDEDAEVDVQVKDVYRVEDLSLGLSDVNLRGRVLATDDVRTFDRDDGSEGRVSNLTLGDPTGRVRATLWDERAPRATELAEGTSVEVVDGYTRERNGELELHVSSRGAVEAVDDDVEYVPETTDVESVELGDTVDLAGGVIETSDVRTFERDGGGEGQVRNVRLRDETGDIRVALWGDHADADVDLGDHVVVTDVEIEDGWQDDLEASANWRSTVSVVEREASAGGETDDATDAGGDAAAGSDLSSFADGGTATETVDGPSDGEETTFTGTVVQTGDPVVLDDGEQTRSVEADERLQLGEQVTVRGRLRDGRIDADEVTR